MLLPASLSLTIALAVLGAGTVAAGGESLELRFHGLEIPDEGYPPGYRETLFSRLRSPVGGRPIAAPVTTDSFKYLDSDGEIRFAPSWEEVPESYRLPRHWSTAAWCSESPTVDDVEQSIELTDIDADGRREVLVFFDDECPNGRRFATLEVIEASDGGEFSIVVTVTASRGYRPELLDLDGDGRFELYGFHWGGAPELWVWDSGEYIDLVRGGTCFGSFWKEAMGKPEAPREETLARVLELYRAGECLQDWSPDPSRVVMDPSRSPRVLALVSWLRERGITLVAEKGTWWVLTRPETPADYEVRVSIRALTGAATEEQMRRELLVYNLAYVLNARSRLAMSYPSFRGSRPETEDLPELDGVPVTEAIMKLFAEYEGSPAP